MINEIRIQGVEFRAIEELNDSVLKKLEELKKKIEEGQPSKYVGRKKFAEEMGVNVSTIDTWERKGYFTGIKLGHLKYFLRADVDKAMLSIKIGRKL